MEDFPKGIFWEIALYLDLPEITKLCRTNTVINSKICRNEGFWNLKIRTDFPDYDGWILNKNFKQTYYLLYRLSEIKRENNINLPLNELYNLIRIGIFNFRL